MALQDGSDLYLLADELSKKFEERIKAAKLDVGPARADRSIPCVWCSPSSDSQQVLTEITDAAFSATHRAPTLEEKILLSQNIYKVSSADLAAVVAILEERCPKALDKSSPDEVDIVVDAIDTKTFRELEKLVLDKVPEGSRDPVSTPKSSRKSSKRSSSSKKAKTEA